MAWKGDRKHVRIVAAALREADPMTKAEAMRQAERLWQENPDLAEAIMKEMMDEDRSEEKYRITVTRNGQVVHVCEDRGRLAELRAQLQEGDVISSGRIEVIWRDDPFKGWGEDSRGKGKGTEELSEEGKIMEGPPRKY